ncbi:MAG: T9SS type A sorting domain-containing protein [Bacteroidales bacterium]|nr:T9SS type A sorting domain-containing protein [Bacteroidales bacterium]
MKKAFLTLITLCISFYGYSQTDTTIYYLNESFETIPRNWQSLPLDDVIKWTYQNGGSSGNPVSAYQGSYNAFFYWNGFESKIRDLVSSPINLSAAVKPRLTFYHTQAQSIDGTDNLKLLFRTSPTASWDTIASYITPISSWTKRSFNIDQEGTQYLTGQFYLAFRGMANGGHGICIDSVKIVETAVITRYINSVTAEDIVYQVVPSGVRALPVFRLEIEVLGNTGTLILDSLKIKSVSDDNSVFETNGFQLFYTQDNIFRNETGGVSTRIGSSASVTNGYIRFNNLSKNIRTGSHYLWLTVDIKPGDIHNQDIDFMVESNSVYISGSSYPGNSLSPAGSNTIEESVFYDNFDTDKGWSLDNDFERDVPQGKFVIKSSDPDYAFSGTRILGTDLSDAGDYLLNIDSLTAYFATTPSMNLKYFDRIKLSMMKWIAFETNDEASIDISTDGGTSWTKLWSSQVSGQNLEFTWNSLFRSDEVNNLAKRQADVKFRFAVNFSDDNNAYAGWNIDNFAVTGEYITNDVGISRIILPCNDCLNSGFDSVKVVIHNYSAVPSSSNLPVFFSLNGKQGPKIYDTLETSIAVDDSVVFTFKTPAGFTGPGNYNFLCATDRYGDQDRTNDSVYALVRIQDNIVPPSLVDFETDSGYWINDGIANTWICKVPDESIGQVPGSPNAWILSPFGFYTDSDSSFLISSCYDLTGSDQLILEMKYTNISQNGHDGANVQYTVNDLITWNVIEDNTYGYSWNWYTSPVSALGQNGWSGNSEGWKTAKTLLPISLLTQPRVKFRILWMSDSDPDDGSRGIALDDFKVYPAPPDIGMASIDTPVDDCLNEVSDQVTVTLKNFGLNKVNANDTIVLGYVFDGNPAVYDTLVLAGDLDPESTTQFSFPEKISFTTARLYQLSVFTLFDDDPWFYGSNNDTLSASIEAFPLPVTELPDTIQSREPDTVIIRAKKDINYEYSWRDTLGTILSTADTLKAPGDGVYYLLVTDAGGNGCSMLDSVYVELLYFDVGIDTIISPVSSCELTDHEQITVRIKNFGTDSIIYNSKIAVSYVYNGGPVVTDTLILSEPLLSGETRQFPFTGKYEDFSAIGVHTLKLFTYFGGDTIRHNDTLNLDVEVYGYPEVDIGGDKVVEALTWPLDAGPGFVTYLWEDGDSVQVHIADETGLYHVTVTDIHGCPGYDTAYIRLKIRDVSPTGLVYPVSACDILGNVNVRIRARNSGNDTIPQDSKIYFKYKLGSQPVKSDSLSLSSPLYPGDTVDRTFTDSEDFSTYGGYDFMLYATTKNDLNAANDTLYDTIFIQPRPVVDFGLDDVFDHRGIEYMLDAGYGEFYDYLWQDESTEQTYLVTRSGLYRVLVTDSRTGCYAGDTVTIYLVYTDVGITAVDLPADTCSGSYSNIQVEISNLYTTTVASGDTINVAYTLNNSIIGNDEFILTSALSFGGKINRNLSGTIDLTDGAPAKLKFYTELDEDLKPANDTFTIDYGMVKRSPVIDFNDVSGVIITEFPYVLTPEAGHLSYLWQDNSTEPTYTVTTPGEYSVTVTAGNGCTTSKTVNVVNETGVEETGDDPFFLKVYPNPALDMLMVEIDARETDDVTIGFYNSGGRLIFNDRAVRGSYYSRSIDINPYPQGIYYIRFYNSEISKVSKVVIQ